jgi:hypothetical protein
MSGAQQHRKKFYFSTQLAIVALIDSYINYHNKKIKGK